MSGFSYDVVDQRPQMCFHPLNILGGIDGTRRVTHSFFWAGSRSGRSPISRPNSDAEQTDGDIQSTTRCRYFISSLSFYMHTMLHYRSKCSLCIVALQIASVNTFIYPLGMDWSRQFLIGVVHLQKSHCKWRNFVLREQHLPPQTRDHEIEINHSCSHRFIPRHHW